MRGPNFFLVNLTPDDIFKARASYHYKAQFRKQHSSFFLIIDQIMSKSNSEFRNLEISKVSLLNKPIKQLRFLNISN